MLGYVHKETGAFGPYEGVRISEIQTTNEMVDGRLMGWARIPDDQNPAYWCTKSRTLTEVMSDDSFWKNAMVLPS